MALSSDKRGVALVEFGMVAPVLILTLMVIFDLGHRTYLNSVLYGAVQKAGRDATLETGSAQLTAIDNKVREQIGPVLLGNVLTVQRTNTRSFTASVGGEIFTDSNNNTFRDTGECFEDENGNGSYDTTAQSTGLGGADDVVTYRATVTFDPVFPIPSLLGLPDNDTLTAITVLRNQPFQDRANVARICT